METDPGADNVQQALKIAMEKFTKVTGKEVDFNQRMTVAQMEDETMEIESGRGAKNEIFKKTLKALYDLGSVTSEAVGTVWPPATICYKALQPLVDMAKNYTAYYTPKNLFETLFEVHDILQTTVQYLKGSRRGARIDKPLEYHLINLLTCFVKVWTIYAKVARDFQSKKMFIPNLFKAAIGYYRGVDEHLEEIRKLRKKGMYMDTAQARIEATVNGNLLQQDRKDKAQIQNRKTIKEKLPFDDRHPAWNSWIIMHDKLRKGTHTRTGEWLFKDKAFQAWADVGRDSIPCKPVLALEGPRGCGKSDLCSSVIDYLHLTHKSQQESRIPKNRVSIAFFYFNKRDKKKASTGVETEEEARQKTTIHDAFTAILWQLSESDTAYQSFAHGQCKSYPGYFSRTPDRWENLVMNYAKPSVSKYRRTFFILLDGIDQVDYETNELEISDTLNHIINKTRLLQGGTFQVRLLLTGSHKSFERLKHVQSDAVVFFPLQTRIPHEEAQRNIRASIKEISESKGPDFQRNRLLKSLENKLCEHYTRQPSTIQIILDSIHGSKRKKDLKELLDSNWDDPTTMIKWQVDSLNNKLQDEEIEDLNDFMACIASLTVWPSLEQLRAFLFLRRGIASGNHVEEQIRDYYSLLFDIDISEKEWVSSCDMMNYLLDEQRPPGIPTSLRSSDQMSNPSLESPIGQIDKSQIALMRNIVRSTYGDQAFQKFRFEDHFNHLQAEQERRPRIRPKIGFEIFESQTRIITRILKAVACPEHRDEAESLHKYAADFLFVHLGKVDEVSHVDKSTRKEIGKYLYRFFHDTSAVENWLEDIPDYRVEDWYDSIKDVVRWFNDREVQAGASENLADSTTYEVATIHDLLSTPATILAVHWLQKNTWSAGNALEWFNFLYGKTFNPSSEIAPNTTTELRKETIQTRVEDQVDVKHVEQAEGYAKKLLKITPEKTNFIWHLRMGETLLEMGQYSEAKNRCQKSLEILERNKDNNEDSEWRAFWCLVRANEREIEEGLKNLVEFLKRLKSSELRKTHSAVLQDMVKELWVLCCEKWKRPSEAMKACHELLEYVSDKSWLMDQAWGLIKNEKEPLFLHDISATPAGDGSSPLTALLRHHANLHEFHETIADILKDDLGLLVKAYVDALKAAEASDPAQHFLRFYYGLALFHQDRSREACIIWEDHLYQRMSSLPRHQEESGVDLQMRMKSAERLLSEYIQLIGLFSSKGEKHLITGKLEKLGEWIERMIGDSDDPIMLLLARAYHLDGQKELAKEYLRTYVSTALELLCDETTDNDWQGYWMLTQACAALEEDKNALAAWSLVNQSTKGQGHLLFTCDGGCQHETTADVHLCRDCVDVQFEQICFRELENGSLGQRVCGKTHQFLRLPTFDPLAARIAVGGSVQVGERAISIDDWKHDMEHLFGIRVSNDEVLVRPEYLLVQRARMLVRRSEVIGRLWGNHQRH